MTLIRNATSATDRPSGPLTLKPIPGKGSGAVVTSPTVGRSATRLLKLAGLRSEPPRSLPSAIGSMPVASATAAPPLDPPALFVRSKGFSVRPNTALYVGERIENSGMLVLVIGITPSGRRREWQT